mgnify:CR=1 FL=1
MTTNYIPNYEEGHIGGSPALDFQSYTRYMVYGDNEGIGRRGYRVGNPLRIALPMTFQTHTRYLWSNGTSASR